MDLENKSLRIGAAAILFALSFRLFCASPLSQWLSRPEFASAIIF